jgi:hypothetical protein
MADATTEGRPDGAMEGLAVGLVDGPRAGAVERVSLGTADCRPERTTLGMADATTEGKLDRAMDGLAVGLFERMLLGVTSVGELVVLPGVAVSVSVVGFPLGVKDGWLAGGLYAIKVEVLEGMADRALDEIVLGAAVGL